ncbi:uncharacterized protein LOC135073479 [Ostrinia nubilalis]
MRELGRGGSFVAATIAALHNRATDSKPRTIKSRSNSAEITNTLRTGTQDHFGEDISRRASDCSERPLSTASEASSRDSASVQSSEEPPPQESGDSDSPDEATVKCTAWKDGAVPARAESSSDSESSSTSEDDSEEREYETQGNDADYRTLTPSRRLDNSTRRDDDFKWMPSGEVTDDRDPMEAKGDDYSAASLDRRRRLPSDRSDRDRKSRSSVSSKPPQHPSSVRASPKPRKHRAEETPPDLHRRWNSYEHFRWPPEGGWWPPMCWCHGPPAPPPCCMHDRAWPSHPSLPPVPARTYKNDAEDRVRRLEADKESLHLQVQVLSEQIAAQNEKMSDLERSLHDARQRLDDAEQRLQKEMLQRSSLETQKLELLSKLSEVRLRVAERGLLERSPPPDAGGPLVRPAPPRTPPANYGRSIERNTHMYSSLPRSSVVASDARVAFAEKEEAIPRGSPSPSLREVRSRLGSGGGGIRLEGDDIARASIRSTGPRPRMTPMPCRDFETTCGWLESLGLEVYAAAARSWLGGAPDARGVIAAASPQTIDKELAVKHPMHKKKIVLALTDLLLVISRDFETTCGWLESLGLEVYAAAARSWLGGAPDARGVIAAASPQTVDKELAVKHPMHKKKIVLALTDLLSGLETTCGWLESLGLEVYAAAARSWLGGAPDARGVIAAASPQTVDKELAVKHPMHKKKIVLALTDLLLVISRDFDTTCGWLESLGLEVYAAAARSWLGGAPDARGVIAAASPQTVDKELAVKHPMHKKKIVLALTDLLLVISRDFETTCGWLESLGLEVYAAAARSWLGGAPDARGVIAAASPQTVDKELAVKHPMHKKKIVLALTDLLGGHGDPMLTASGQLDTAWALRWLEDIGVCGARGAASEAALDGRLLHRLSHSELHAHLRVTHALHALSIRRVSGQLDTAWALRWLEDIGVCGARGAASEAALDGRLLHRLSHSELHAHLRVTHALHALSIRRGIQVLRENKFNPETMIRRAVEGEATGGEDGEPATGLARWSSHRVMQWLKEIDLAEYAPNLRGAGVHGGLMLLEPRFTAELLAALLNIPANKTLLRRHLTQRFNDLLGRDVIQQKRNAEQTLGYQPLTATTKYKVPKKSQFSLKRKKSKDELDLVDLVCPLHDDCSGDAPTSPTMKVKSATAGVASAVSPQRDDARAQ